MKTIVLTVILTALSSPAFAGACWQNAAGDRLSFSNATDGQLRSHTGKKQDCSSGESEDGSDIACGSDAWSPSVRVPAKAGYVLHDVLVWRGEAWYPDCK